MTAAELIAALELRPLPVEGGFYRETYRSKLATAIFYLLTPDTFSALHRLASDEIYHFYLGDPVEMLLLSPDGTGRQVVLGNDLARGQQVQLVVPAGVWQGSRLAANGEAALLGTTMAPGFNFADFELGKREALVARYPDFRERIERLTRVV